MIERASSKPGSRSSTPCEAKSRDLCHSCERVISPEPEALGRVSSGLPDSEWLVPVLRDFQIINRQSQSTTVRRYSFATPVTREPLWLKLRVRALVRSGR